MTTPKVHDEAQLLRAAMLRADHALAVVADSLPFTAPIQRRISDARGILADALGGEPPPAIEPGRGQMTIARREARVLARILGDCLARFDGLGLKEEAVARAFIAVEARVG